jgi:hypothetical protein
VFSWRERFAHAFFFARRGRSALQGFSFFLATALDYPLFVFQSCCDGVQANATYAGTSEMSDVIAEINERMSIDQVAKSLRGTNGNPISFSTVWRWVLKGINGANGERVRLRAIRLGGRYLISERDLEEFTAALSAIEPGVRKRAPDKRKAGRVSKRLDAARI